MAPTDGVTIRDMREADVPRVFEMVLDLARFLAEDAYVTATADDLRRDGFGREPKFRCLVAERGRDGALLGYAAYSSNYSTFQGNSYLYIDDLFVAPVARGSGLARRLVASVAARALAVDRGRGEGRLALTVVDWNPAREMYRRLGFRHETTSQRQVIEGEALRRLAREACC